MIASRSGTTPLPRVTWRRTAKQSLNSLMDFLEANAYGNSNARRREIRDAVELLRHAPLRCPVVDVKDGATFRRLIVCNRFYVYYVYNAPRGGRSGGTISIRAVKHAASRNPFWGVREQGANDQPLAMLSTRDSMDAAIGHLPLGRSDDYRVIDSAPMDS